LAIDAGKTDTRVGLFEGGSPAAVRELVVGTDAGNISHRPADRVARALAAVDLPAGGVEAAAAGIAGFESMSARELAGLADMLDEAVGAESVVLASDGVTAHLGALGGEPGVVVAAGTGTVVLGWDGDGRCAKVDGWGQLLDDAGSAYAIGRQGLASALREHDGRGGSSELHARAENVFGPLDALPLLVERSASAVRTVASFAPEVAAAAREGDDAALAIFADAGVELARGAVAAADRTFPDGASVAISLCGGVSAAWDLIEPSFTEAIAARRPDAVLVEPRGSALAGARRLATGDYDSAFSELVWRRAA
jgi:N-acetylglucosamine kinase-like BadF-type ATPase